METVFLFALALNATSSDDPPPIVPPSPGAETAKAGPPTWCEGSGIEAQTGTDKRTADRAGRGIWSFRNNNSAGRNGNNKAIAENACMWPDIEYVQKWTAAFRQELMNDTLLTEAEVSDYYKMILDKEGKPWKEQQAWCKGLGANTKMSNFDVWQDVAIRSGLCTEADLFMKAQNAGMDLAFWLDRAGQGTPLLHMLYAGACSFGEPSAAAWAKCQTDYATLDKAAVMKDAEKFPAFTKITLSALFNRIKRFADASKVKWDEAVKKGGVCETVYKTDPDAAIAKVKKDFETYAAALKTAYDVRDKVLASGNWTDATSGKLKIGCGDLKKQLLDYVRAQKPKTADDAQTAAAGSAVGGLLMSTYAMCEGVEGRWQSASFFTVLARSRMAVTGERGAAQEALMKSWYKNIATVDSCGRVDQNGLQTAAKNPLLALTNWTWSGHTNGPPTVSIGDPDLAEPGRDGYGVVQSVKKTAAGTDIVFKKETVYVQTVNCKDTNQVNYFALDGTPQYYRNCTWGPVVPQVVQTPARTFETWTVDGVKPGIALAYVMVEESSRPYTKTAFNLVTFQRRKGAKDHSKILTWLGIPLAK